MSVMGESQWHNLPAEILTVIVDKLDSDVNRLIIPTPVIYNLLVLSVCKSWRSSIPRASPSPTIILPFPISPNPHLNPNRHGHFTLSHSTIYLLQHHSSYWLLRVENTNSNKWSLLNPLSRILLDGLPDGFPKSIDLLNCRVSRIATPYSLHFVDTSADPNLPLDFQELKSLYFKKVAVSKSTSSVDIMVISVAKLWFLRLGDEKWRAVEGSRYDDVVFHRGKFYAVDIAGRVVSVDSDLKVVEIAPRLGYYSHGGNFKSLVVSNGELFLIDKYTEPDENVWYDEDVGAYKAETDEGGAHIKIYKLNEGNGEWEGVRDLDDQVFFVGMIALTPFLLVNFFLSNLIVLTSVMIRLKTLMKIL